MVFVAEMPKWYIWNIQMRSNQTLVQDPLKFILFIVAFFLCAATGSAQNSTDPGNLINLGRFHDKLLLTPTEYQIAFSDQSFTDINAITHLRFNPVSAELNPDGKIRDNLNVKHLYLRFSLLNPADTAEHIFFYPGYYFKAIHLYKANQGSDSMLQVLPDILPGTGMKDAYRMISLQAKEKSLFYAQLQPVKIRINKVEPTLIRNDYLLTHSLLVSNDNPSLTVLTYILVGIMCMMVLFAVANYILSGKEEFLYYCLYAALIAFLLFAKTYLYRSATDFTYFFEEYLDFMMMLTGMVCYVAFLRHFLSTQKQYPLLDRILSVIEVIFICFLVVYSLMYFLVDDVVGMDTMENTMKYIMLGGGLLFVIIGLRANKRLINYLVWGNLSMVTAGFISLYYITRGVSSGSIFSSALFYYDIGVVTELAFFLFGLTYKGRLELIEKVKIEDAMNLEREKKEFEKQLTIIQTQQEERNRISADMHDELGGGMTAIRLMSELAKQRMSASSFPEIEKISASANDLLGKMNAIIWSMSPANDTLANLVAYIRSYAYDFFESTSIHCIIAVKEDIPLIEMSGIKRRNIFLGLKEALNNVVKHARATEVVITIDFENTLLITIQDNGGGMKMEKANQFGNGLNNMRRRMEAIGGAFTITNSNGCTVMLQTAL